MKKENISISGMKIRHVILAGMFIFLFAACSSGSVPVATQTTPTPVAPTPLPKGTVLYQADWTHHLQDWQPSAGWRVVQGSVESKTQGDLSLTVPYRPTVNDYALEFRLQVVKMTQPLGSFQFAVDPLPGKNGYQASILEFPRADKETNSIHPQVEVFAEPVDAANPGVAHDQTIGYVWHDYRIEIHGARVDFYIDDQLSGRALCQTKTVANGPIKFTASDIGLRMSEFRVVVA